MTKRFDRFTDQKTAAANDSDGGLRCCAFGCPNRWSVELNGQRCCSAHAWVERHEWPRITEQQQHADVERARNRANAPVTPPEGRLTIERKREILQGLSALSNDFGRPRDLKQWARDLRARDKAGEKLTHTQRTMYLAALAPRGGVGDEEGLGCEGRN